MSYMKTKYFLFAILALWLMSCSCGRENISFALGDDSPKITESRSLRGFECIEVFGSPTVYYQQADSFSVMVKGPQKLVDHILTEVENGKLTIRNRGKLGLFNVSLGGDNQLAVYVTSPDLVSVSLLGSGDFISEKAIDTDVMNINLKGSGDIQFADLLCDRCNLELVGSGDASIRNLDTRETNITLIGSGDVKVRQQNATATRIVLRGSGDVDVDFASGCGSVDAQLVGSGDIDLRGRVQSMQQHKSGSGDIDADHLKVGK
jgi:hypothetical protein